MVQLLKFKDFDIIKQFLEVSRDAVFIIYDEQVKYVNDIAVQMLRYNEPSDIIGKWSCELMHSDDKKLTYKPASRNTPFLYEMKYKRKDGTKIQVENQISLIEYNGIPCSLIFSRDISERKKFELKLNTLHKHASDIRGLETIDELIKKTVKIIKHSLGFDYVGFGIVIGDILYFKETSDNTNTLKLSLKGRGISVRAVRTGETQFVSDIRKDQEYISVRYFNEVETLSEICVPLRVNDKIFGVINVEAGRINAFDDNDRKLLETLSGHVESSLSVLLEKEKLNKSLVELQNVNRDLDEYTYAVSHDLKAPLRTIQAFGEYVLGLESLKYEEEAQQHLERIIKASDRMQVLIDNLLQLSRVNREDLEEELIDLNELVEEIISDIQADVNERKATIQFEGLPSLNGHKVWISQVFSNLINNGLKYNESQEPKIWIDYQEHYEYYMFSIKDNGIGMEPKNFEIIFKLFQRLHGQEKYSGSGAGLTICKKIVESYGGRIWLESQLNEGSTFYFTLPKNVSSKNLHNVNTEFTEYISQSIDPIPIK